MTSIDNREDSQQSSDDRPVPIGRLLEEELPSLLGYIRLNVHPKIRDHESCADLVQTVCREVLEHENSFDYRGRPAFRSWLYKTVRNKLVDRLRRATAIKRDVDREVRISNISHASGIPSLYEPFFSPSQAAIHKEEVEILERVMQQLPDDYKEVIICKYYLQMKSAEIAEEMGRTVPAARTLLHRAKVRLGLLMHRAEQAQLTNARGEA